MLLLDFMISVFLVTLVEVKLGNRGMENGGVHWVIGLR